MPRPPGTAPARSARARDTPGAGRERLFLCGRIRQGKPFLAIFSGCFAVINVAIRGVQGLVSSLVLGSRAGEGGGQPLDWRESLPRGASGQATHGRCEKEKRKFSIFCLTATRLSRRYTSSRPHRLAGPGQRPFTPSTAVQIRLGTPKISIGYSSSVFGLQELGYNFSSGDILLRNFCFKQVFHYLPDAAASQSRKNFALVRVQPRALRIAIRCSRSIMSHKDLGGIQT